jgi:DNA-binding transcriptional regulator YiaG
VIRWSGRTVTPKQFKAAIDELGLSQGRAARLCGFHPRTAKRWASGGRKVPEPVAIILRLMLAGELTIEQMESAADKPVKSKRK